MTARVGFLGGGFIATYHGKMLHSGGADCEIALVHDPDEAKGRAFAAASGATFVESEEAVLDGSDAVYVCTWTAEHRRLVDAVAARGLPVFCEKPLAFDATEAQAMVDAVTAAGVTNQVGLVLRDSPAFLWLRHLVQRPESGRVMSVVFRDDQFLPTQGMYGSSWRADPSKAGSGTLLEHSIHDLDIVEWLFGPVASVVAQTAEFHELAGIEDLAVSMLRFESGAIGTLTSVWHDLLERPSLRRMEVLCEKAHYVLEGDVFGPVLWTRPDGDAGSIENDGLLAALADEGIVFRNPDVAFIDAVKAGTPAYPDFATALRPHALAEAIYASAAAGGTPVPTPSS